MSLLSYCHPLMVLTSLAERVFSPEIFIHLKRLKASADLGRQSAAASRSLYSCEPAVASKSWEAQGHAAEASELRISQGKGKSWTQKVGHKVFFSDAAQQASTSVPVALPSKLQTLPNQCSIGLSRAQGLPFFSRNSR